jgi:acyl-CoA thioesterase
LIIGNASKKFTYRVSVIRSGASYAQRRVDVVQNPKKDIVFTAVVSFKVAEESPVNCSRGQRLKEKYGVVIAGREPESWPEAPSVDSPL